MLLVNVTDVKSCWEILLEAPITINVTQLQDERHGADGCALKTWRRVEKTQHGEEVVRKKPGPPSH